ncbi:hypothetical protein WMY93_033839 [Mugilogobius chulae]|uniref:Uncharacterized protein n=1 Tax=Mugilogobius chulae TaxID=88201 RepID=A0AAW0MJJ7_9GOBI
MGAAGAQGTETLEEQLLSFVKLQLKTFCRILSSDPEPDQEPYQDHRSQAVLTLVLDFLKSMGHEQLADVLQTSKSDTAERVGWKWKMFSEIHNKYT